MKRMFALAFTVAITGALLPINSSAQSSRNVVLSLLKKYSPTGYYIVMTYDRAPTEINTRFGRMHMSKTDFMAFTRGTSIMEILSSLNTIVHETCHGYTSRMGFTNDGNSSLFGGRPMAFYLDGQENIIVQTTKVFPSKKIVADFPHEIRTFRFPRYVDSPSPHLGTQQSGIYGLLDEMNAYYHGTRTAYDMLPYYKSLNRQDVKTWLNFFQSVNGTYYAHLEFKLFILRYLKYAKKNNPEVYTGVMGNEKFRKAFSRVDDNFKRLIEKYFKEKENIFTHMRKHGINATEQGRFIRFGNIRSGNFLDTYKLLKKELQKEEYQELLNRLNE